jgi:hypothetical protein
MLMGNEEAEAGCGGGVHQEGRLLYLVWGYEKFRVFGQTSGDALMRLMPQSACVVMVYIVQDIMMRESSVESSPVGPSGSDIHQNRITQSRRQRRWRRRW